jgi:hypothetical protein
MLETKEKKYYLEYLIIALQLGTCFLLNYEIIGKKIEYDEILKYEFTIFIILSIT